MPWCPKTRVGSTPPGPKQDDIAWLTLGLGNYVASENLDAKNPLFVGADHSDFYLRKDSPAIDSARMQAVAATDLDGTARPQGGARDIGAFEYHE